jgi:HlyD family secretion protein
VRARDIKWMVFLCITILLLGLMSGCSSFNNIIKEEQDDKKATTSEKIPVEVVAARIGNIQVVREFAGKLRPVKDIMIIPKIPGKVTKIHVKIGQEVKQGDILIELDGTDVNYQVAQAQSAYDASKASVELSKQNLRELKARNKELEDEVRTLNQRTEEVKKTLSETEQAISPEVAKLLKQLREGKITPRRVRCI